MANKKKKENKFQADLIDELEERFEGSLVFKMDPRQYGGIPDLLILYEDKWASLECKREDGSSRRPRQPYYVNKMNEMSFSRFVSPENKEEVLNELQSTFQPER